MRVASFRLIARPQLIRHLMERHGLSIRELAAEVGTSKTTVEQLRNGQRIDTDQRTAEGFEQVFNVEPGTLFTRIRTRLPSAEAVAA